MSVSEKGNGSSIFSIQALSLQITLYLYKLEPSLNLAFSIHNNETLYCLREEPDASIFISTAVLCTAILSVNSNSLTIIPYQIAHFSYFSDFLTEIIIWMSHCLEISFSRQLSPLFWIQFHCTCLHVGRKQSGVLPSCETNQPLI